jgi:hypothetical protein
MSKSTLRRILAFVKANLIDLIIARKPGSENQRKISMETRRLLKKNMSENPSFSAGKLRRCTPALENLSIRTIKKCCLTDLMIGFI